MKYLHCAIIVESEDYVESKSEMLMDMVPSSKSESDTLSSVATAVQIAPTPLPCHR